MKVLNVSCSAQRGGAATAAWRLHCSLRKAGTDSALFAMESDGLAKADEVYAPSTFTRNLFYRARKNIELHSPRALYPKLKTSFSPGWLGESPDYILSEIKPDLINLHWVNNGHLSLQSIGNLQLPIVWTLHDMWAFTGGCHYAGTCSRFQTTCGHCPQLGSTNPSDLSAKRLLRKKHHFSGLNLHIVTPSNWLASCVRQSALFREYPIRVIPNGIDTQVFSPKRESTLRNRLGIPESASCLLFAAINATAERRKGFKQLLNAIDQIPQPNNLHLLIAGATANDLHELPYPTHALGMLKGDAAMAEAYNLADVFVAPSVEDNLPNTVLESLACGTPVVAFNIGGMPDMIIDGHNGRLAVQKSEASLTEGITWVLKHPNPSKLREAARITVEEKFTLSHQTKAYVNLYKSLL